MVRELVPQPNANVRPGRKRGRRRRGGEIKGRRIEERKQSEDGIKRKTYLR